MIRLRRPSGNSLADPQLSPRPGHPGGGPRDYFIEIPPRIRTFRIVKSGTRSGSSPTLVDDALAEISTCSDN